MLIRNQLELSTPNLVHVYSMAVARHAFTWKPKGQRLRSHSYKDCHGCMAASACCCSHVLLLLLTWDARVIESCTACRVSVWKKASTVFMTDVVLHQCDIANDNASCQVRLSMVIRRSISSWQVTLLTVVWRTISRQNCYCHRLMASFWRHSTLHSLQ